MADKQYLEDLLLKELEPELTLAVTNQGFEKIQLEEPKVDEKDRINEAGTLKGRDKFMERDWRGDDFLVYENKIAGILIYLSKHPDRSSSLYEDVWPLLSQFRFDLSKHPDLKGEQAISFRPNAKMLARLSDSFAKTDGYVPVGLSEGLTDICHGDVHPLFTTHPITGNTAYAKSHQLYFTHVYEFRRDKNVPLEGQRKIDFIKGVIQDLNATIGYTVLYVQRETAVWNAMNDKDKLYSKAMQL